MTTFEVWDQHHTAPTPLLRGLTTSLTRALGYRQTGREMAVVFAEACLCDSICILKT